MEEYGVIGGYEDGLEEDDEQGSRAIPSRTALGCEAAFIEKFPCYGGFRFGVRNFSYRWQLTLPQIEIMSADLPHTLYRSASKGKVTQGEVDDAERKMKEAYEKKKKYTVDEVFEGKADKDNTEQ